MLALPPYVVINDPAQAKTAPDMLLRPAEPFSFPLSKNDLKIINILEAKFKIEQNCAGLAAPQIGFNKQAIVFEVSADPELIKSRPTLKQTMPRVTWLNPTYEPIGKETESDYEGCFSVAQYAGPVARFKKIHYTAFSITGKKITGTASGFLARVIQHEVDHIRGVLFISKVPPDELLTKDECLAKRRKFTEDHG